MRIIDCIQGSAEWHQARLGIPTASNASKILTPSGKLSSSSEAYLGELLAAWVLGEPADNEFMSEAMERGKMLEPEAFAEYAFLHDVEPEKVGFCLHDTLDAGASPDALVGDDGLVEFKAPSAGKHLVYLFRDSCPREYIMQVQFQLWVTGRDFCDFCSYHPDLPLFVCRIEPDEKIQTALDMWVEHFLKELELGKARLREYGVTPWTEGGMKNNGGKDRMKTEIYKASIVGIIISLILMALLLIWDVSVANAQCYQDPYCTMLENRRLEQQQQQWQMNQQNQWYYEQQQQQRRHNEQLWQQQRDSGYNSYDTWDPW